MKWLSNVKAVFRREFKSYFDSPVAYVFLTAFLVLVGFLTFGVAMFYERRQADLMPFFFWHPWVYLLLVPAATMGTWADERRNGTAELLLTLPMTATQALVGKFLAAWAFLGIALALTFPVAATAAYLKEEVSDGVIAPGYTPEALEILKTKKKGKYNVVQIDPSYVPAELECKDVFGIRFEQGHNNFKIDEELLKNIVTENHDLPRQAQIDMIVALITLKYTQSNSVCYVKDGQAIGVGAGQQSRIHCTRLAGSKADNWYLRQHPKVLALEFVDGIRRPDRDNAIDIYTSDEYEDVLAEGAWQKVFKTKPDVLTAEEKKAWIATQSGVTCGSDAFFPFGDNVERARKSGVQYIAEPGGSIRDDHVIETANKYGMTMCFTGMRLFHH